MSYKIEQIEGIGPTFGQKLAAADISTTDHLLDLCCTPKGRKDVAEKTGLGRLWIGVLLLAFITSIPELITGLSSVLIFATPDIAAGAVVGSCVFNMLILAMLDIFDRSLKYDRYDSGIRARTYYWLGEAAYRSGDMEMANMYFTEFMQDNVSRQMKEYALGHYSMGYVYFDQEKYGEAENWFNSYIRLEKNSKLL